MKQKIIKKIIIISGFFYPAVSFAALDGVKGLITAVGGLINSVVAIIFGLALIFFFWGIAQFILNSADQKSREEGKKKMFWGVIALFVFLSIYGIIEFIGVNLGIDTGLNSGAGTGSNPNCYPSDVWAGTDGC